MPKPLLRSVLQALIAASALPLAHADIYTWTDDKGRVNISNLEPPEGARVTSVLRESKAMKEANLAAREAAREREREALREAEVKALAERVRQLQVEVETAKRPAPPVVAAAPVPPYVPYTGEYAPPVAQYNYINASPVMGGGGGGGGSCYTGWPDCQFGWYPGFYPAYYPVNVIVPKDRHFRRDQFPPHATPYFRAPVAPWAPMRPGRGH